MPGNEPNNKLPSKTKSTVPNARCPIPASAVSGTAWTMSVPTTFTAAIRGYKNSSATVPNTPAPTEEIVTNTPTTAPTSMVAAGKWRWCNSSIEPTSRRAIFLMASLNNNAAAVASKATLNTPVTKPRSVFSSNTRYFNKMIVIAAAGKLPIANSPATFQSTEPLRACTQPPKDLVSAAYNKSVPTAVTGDTPNNNTSSGVISEPPPTPVTPTTSPTKKPDNVYIASTLNCPIEFMK